MAGQSEITMFRSLQHPGALAVTLAAAGILMVTMGSRQSLGLIIAPLNADTNLGIVTISLALAVGQFIWGATQPVAGALADRYGPRPVLIGGSRDHSSAVSLTAISKLP